MNPEITHDHHTAEQRKRKASGDDHDVELRYASQVTNLQQSSSSSYNINGSADIIPTIVCCPCVNCHCGWHDSMPTAVMNDLDSLPIGYRFKPTDEELIKHYLMKKINNESVPKSKISDADIYESHPKDVVGMYPQAIEDGWYFFTPRNRKYARGKRPDRQAGPGYWRATGPDKVIKDMDIKIGGRKSLVFYEGHSPDWIKTKWMMHEYVVEGYVRTPLNSEDIKLDDYVLCKIYINRKMKDEVDTDHQESDIAPNDLDANVANNVQVENELALVPLDQPGHILLSYQDADHVNNFHGDQNNVAAVIQHDFGQNLNTLRTCMGSLAVSNNNNNVHPAFQVTNNVAPRSYQNMGDHVSNFLGDHNNVAAVIQHDSGQNLNNIRTCMSSLADNKNNVHPGFRVTNNVAPRSYQNMESLYDPKQQYSRLNDSFPIRFNHEYSLQPLYIAPTPHQPPTPPPPPHNMQPVMYRSGPTSNPPMPQVAPSFQEEGDLDPANLLRRNNECVVGKHEYDGFLDCSYSPDFNGIDEDIDADQPKIN